MNEYLQPGRYVDSTHPAVIGFARLHAHGANDRERAMALYYAVRDTIRYNPFQNFMADDTYRASACLERNLGFRHAGCRLGAGRQRLQLGHRPHHFAPCVVQPILQLLDLCFLLECLQLETPSALLERGVAHDRQRWGRP